MDSSRVKLVGSINVSYKAYRATESAARPLLMEEERSLNYLTIVGIEMAESSSSLIAFSTSPK